MVVMVIKGVLVNLVYVWCCFFVCIYFFSIQVLGVLVSGCDLGMLIFGGLIVVELDVCVISYVCYVGYYELLVVGVDVSQLFGVVDVLLMWCVCIWNC